MAMRSAVMVDCEAPTCGINEVYSTCTNGGCSRRNCSQLDKPEICINRTPESCTKGCVCADGYLRNATGTCVLENQCPQPGCGGDPNAQPGCGINCGRRCSDYKVKNKELICPRIQCKPDKCDCKDGFVFDDNLKICVVPEQCTPVCGLNEKYDSCVNGGCDHRNCSQVGTPRICIRRTPESCIKGCVCSDGYLRADNGTCIPQDQCPTSSGCGGDINAHSGCGVNCGKTCATYKAKNPICPRICKVGGCDCNDGYVYDDNVGRCVLPDDCTPETDDRCPGQNEYYNTCISGCSNQSCDSIGKVFHCPIQPAVCREGCRCQAGYWRNADNVCVPESECPTSSNQCTGQNEFFDTCISGCSNQTCDSIGKVYNCPIQPAVCRTGCRCKQGFYRNADNVCVAESECRTGCGGDINAHSGCGVNCGKTCATYKAKNPICPRICKVGGCDCNEGYVYDANVGRCVLPDDCTPETDDRCPGQNEYYNTCISGCSNQSCDSIGKVFDCPIQPAVCREACWCKAGYWRNADNVCVPESECPTSSNQCTGQNEFFDTCISGCSNQTCDSIGKKYSCPLEPAVCRTGCRCKQGFYRNADNVCVAESECPSSKNQCTGQNEFFDTCISGCSNQTCDSIGKVYNCPLESAVCRTGCRCNPGFYRNASNVCVAERECPAPPCPEGETYNRCPTVACEGDYCPKDRNSPQTCPVGIVCDPPRCTCGPLDKRDRVTKKCIKAYACPPFKCDGRNEHYDSCPAGCPGERCSDYVSGAKCPPFRIGIVVPCNPACKCNKGYYRNSNNTCVKASECGPVATNNKSVNIETPTTEESTTTAKPTTGSSTSDAIANLKTGVTNFNGEFLYERLIAEPGKNLITSPYSVVTPLVQLFLYTTGDAFQQLSTVLNVSTKEQIRSAFPEFVSSFEGQTSVNFSAAAIVYSNMNYPLSDSFKKDSVDVAHAEAEELDFSKNTEAADTINSWAESHTNNRIRDLIQPSDLSALTRLVLVNAIYFKGEWHYAFNKNNTLKDADFYLSDGTTKKTNLMHQEGQFNYGAVPELNCTVLQMFYKGDNFSMIVVLPNEKDGLLQVAKNLQLQPNFDKVTGSLSRQKVKVYLPPFKIETTTDLSDILKKLGVTKIFDSKDSGLSGLLKTPESTYVSKATQKAFIEVDEEGSEAAAANGIIVSTRTLPAPPPPQSIVFRADRPFLFYIRLQDTTMFCGGKNDV